MDVELYIENEDGGQRSERVAVSGPLAIGRHSQCTVYLDGDRVSRVHAVIELREGGFYLEDRSSNGTIVGDRLVRKEAVEAPYWTPVVIGAHTLFFRPASSTGAPEPSAGAPAPLPMPRPPPMPGHLLETSTQNPTMAAAFGQRHEVEDPTAADPGHMDLGDSGAPPRAPQRPSTALRPPPPQAPPPQGRVHEAGVVKPSAPPMVPAERVILGAGLGPPPEPPPPAPPMFSALGPPPAMPPSGMPPQGMPPPGMPQPSPSGMGMHPHAPPPMPSGMGMHPHAPPPAPPSSMGMSTQVPPAPPSNMGPPMPPPTMQGPPANMSLPLQTMQGHAPLGAAHGPAPGGPPHGSPHGSPQGDGAAAPTGARPMDEYAALRREIHAKLLENLDLAKLDAAKLDDPSMRPRVLVALRRIIGQMATRLDPSADRDALVGELADEALGLGPLERFLSDPTVSEIMVVDPQTIYVEQGGKIVLTGMRFTDDERVRAVIERIVTPLGRRIDESSPLVDARLKDGSRVNAVIKPLALRGSCITIRRFSKVPLTMDKLVGFGALTQRMARFLERSVSVKKNIIISGGTGSGKTTLLNVLSSAIPTDERIVTIEDAAELQLGQPHVVGMESRPANMEGRGEYTIRDLVRNALRMRPDRIVVGECRGGEALDMLQAMNTGHDGSLTTTHSNSPPEAVARIETLALMGGLDLPSRAIREQIAASIHVVVQQTRFSDGSRKVSDISEVSGIEDDGTIGIRPIFQFVRTGTGPGGKVLGEHRATGYLPSYLEDFIVAGLVRPGEPYL
ncbi:ATPase, T2SS/T4P/T4SS family [Chondromyces apiculatus]|uniref:Type II/IV secretion system ATP hydrolase TadA/VirB11/CpaF, TadA subfamily n=1 Tax=Chondromyces apiculatus DSM 436 TaxID=1192034 RepID=A0A017TBD3_9BACT|nr:ATPase, T2SS/T4P/T4SS family [Chondromyces apiculatus]EYF06578.1 Type II/IV secretion system ATP hydrolase TadA/VirB11/CpaF, TadA subfamily [Chondromyces apiculatus DSM 436]